MAGLEIALLFTLFYFIFIKLPGIFSQDVEPQSSENNLLYFVYRGRISPHYSNYVLKPFELESAFLFFARYYISYSMSSFFNDKYENIFDSEASWSLNNFYRAYRVQVGPRMTRIKHELHELKII